MGNCVVGGAGRLSLLCRYDKKLQLLKEKVGVGDEIQKTALKSNRKDYGIEHPLKMTFNTKSHGLDVTAVVCSDANGLVLASCGMAVPESCGGGLAAVAEAAAAIEPANKATPVVLIEGETSKVNIHRTDGVTVAVYKSQSQQRLL